MSSTSMLSAPSDLGAELAPRGRAAAARLVVAAALARVAALQRLDAGKADLQRGALLAVLALPLAGAQLALGEDLVSLTQALSRPFGRLLPQLDPEPLRLLLPLTVRT